MKNLLKISLIALISLSMVACTQSEIITTLEATLDAAIGADATLRPQDIPYLQEVSNCVQGAINEFGTVDTPVIKASKISLVCAVAVDQGKTATIGTQAVVVALASFLNAIENAKTAIGFSHPEFANSFAGGKRTQLSKKDLAKVQKKLDKLKKKLSKKK